MFGTSSKSELHRATLEKSSAKDGGPKHKFLLGLSHALRLMTSDFFATNPFPSVFDIRIKRTKSIRLELDKTLRAITPSFYLPAIDKFKYFSSKSVMTVLMLSKRI